jgi:hypothetical protein
MGWCVSLAEEYLRPWGERSAAIGGAHTVTVGSADRPL